MDLQLSQNKNKEENQQKLSQIQSSTLQIFQHKRKWLCIGYNHDELKNIKYQYVYRPMTKQSNNNLNQQQNSNIKGNHKKSMDGIQIIPIIEYKSKDYKQIIFIANFRPAVGKFVLEFPAGLAEGQESIIKNAQRQLEQQCGLKAYKYIFQDQPIIYADPNKGNQSGMHIIALINGQDQQSFVDYKREHTQNIRCYSLKYYNIKPSQLQGSKIQKRTQICQQLEKFTKQNDYIYDAKTWTVCMGIDIALKMNELFNFNFKEQEK